MNLNISIICDTLAACSSCEISHGTVTSQVHRLRSGRTTLSKESFQTPSLATSLHACKLKSDQQILIKKSKHTVSLTIC